MTLRYRDHIGWNSRKIIQFTPPSPIRFNSTVASRRRRRIGHQPHSLHRVGYQRTEVHKTSARALGRVFIITFSRALVNFQSALSRSSSPGWVRRTCGSPGVRGNQYDSCWADSCEATEPSPARPDPSRPGPAARRDATARHRCSPAKAPARRLPKASQTACH